MSIPRQKTERRYNDPPDPGTHPVKTLVSIFHFPTFCFLFAYCVIVILATAKTLEWTIIKTVLAAIFSILASPGLKLIYDEVNRLL